MTTYENSSERQDFYHYFLLWKKTSKTYNICIYGQKFIFIIELSAKKTGGGGLLIQSGKLRMQLSRNYKMPKRSANLANTLVLFIVTQGCIFSQMFFLLHSLLIFLKTVISWFSFCFSSIVDTDLFARFS